MALASSHSIFHYSIFLSLLLHKKSLPERQLLVLDEGHLLETEIVKYRGLTISKRRWRRYIHDLKMVDYGYDDIERWIDFLIELETKMLTLTGNSDLIESFSIERKVKYSYNGKKISSLKDTKKTVSASDIFDSDEEIVQKYDTSTASISTANLGDELAVDAIRDTERLTRTIRSSTRSGIDTDARWGFSHTKGWIFGYKLHITSSTGSLIVPLSAVFPQADVQDNQIYLAITSSLPQGVCYMAA